MTKSQRRTLIHGGEVLTQNDRRETHAAIVLEGDTVLATGSLSDMKSLAGASAFAVDVQGGCVLPGLIDSHPHFLHMAAFDFFCVDLYDARSHEEILTRIRERTKVMPPGQWILTTPVGEPYYFLRRSWQNLPEGRLPNRSELDAVAPNHPLLLQAYAPKIPNVCAMNSRALQELGFTRDLPDRVGDVFIEKDARGELTGIFSGSVTNYYNPDEFWRTRVLNRLPPPPEELWYLGALAGQQRAAQRGVTAAYEAHAMDASHIAAYQRVRNEGRSTLRVLAALEIASHAFDLGVNLTEAGMRANFGLATKLRQTSDPLFRVDGMTLCRGGPCWPGFMRTEQPYKDAFGRATRGRTFVPQSIEREAIEYALQNAVRLNLVQGGYVDHREFLESLEPFLDQWDVPSREWIIQHSILIDPKTIERYAQLNFHLTSSLSFCFGKGDLYAERIGEHVLPDLAPIGKMMRSGANVSLGSDWGPASAFEHMALGETREFAGSGRRHADPDNIIDRQQALDGWTRNNARLMHWEGIGTLGPGSKADIAIVDRNPLTCSLDELPNTRVLKTVLGGREVFDTQVLRGLAED